jgi:Trypsin-co-occurring domain 2
VQVTNDGVPVDVLIKVIKDSVRRAGVSRVAGRGDLRVVSVQLTLRVMASTTAGGGLRLRVPVIGAEIGVGAKVIRQDTHIIDITLVPPEQVLREVRGGDVENALVDAIATIRDTVATAAEGDDPWVLSISTVDISFVITKSGTISFGAEGDLTNEVTQNLRLGLAPAGA